MLQQHRGEAVERRLDGGDLEEDLVRAPLLIEHLTDGAEVTHTSPQGLPTTSTLRWDGSALVLAMQIKGPGFEATNDVRYELLNDGRRLRATEQGRSPQAGNHNAVWIYDRR